MKYKANSWKKLSGNIYHAKSWKQNGHANRCMETKCSCNIMQTDGNKIGGNKMVMKYRAQSWKENGQALCNSMQTKWLERKWSC